MVEISEKPKELPQESESWNGLPSSILFVSIWLILRNIVSVPVAWLIAIAITSCVDYRMMPKPNFSFLKYFVVMQAWAIAAVVAIWFIPQQLQQVLPQFWAYTLPALLFFNIIYFVPPLEGGKRETAWWKWALGSFGFAILVGLVMTYLWR